MKRLRVPFLAVALLALRAAPALAADRHGTDGTSAAGPPRPRPAGRPGPHQAHRRHLRGEPLLRQPLRRLGGRRRPRGAPTPRTRARSTRAARRTTACCRTTSTSRRRRCRPACTDRRRRRLHEPVPERAVPDRRLHRADRHDLPGAGRVRAERRAQGQGEPGGCTRDLVHRFYQEQYQLNGGPQNRYVTGSDAVGLTMGVYDTKKLPIYAYLHGRGHPDYVIADRFFQAAFGGSFLNHQWLIAAATPTFPSVADGGADDLHSLVDANGMPNATYPLYTPTRDGARRRADRRVRTPHPAGLACGDFAVNTIQPAFQPFAPGTRRRAGCRRRPAPTIGDRLSARASTGPGTRAAGRTPTATSTRPAGRTATRRAVHRPEHGCRARSTRTARTSCSSSTTSRSTTSPRSRRARGRGRSTCATRQEFSAPPPARASAAGSSRSASSSRSAPRTSTRATPASTTGSDHLVDLLSASQGSRCAQGHDGRRDLRRVRRPVGPRPAAGPGHDDARAARRDGPEHADPGADARAGLQRGFVVDHVSHDTTSIMATIEHRFGLHAGELARRGGQGPVDRVRRDERRLVPAARRRAVRPPAGAPIVRGPRRRLGPLPLRAAAMEERPGDPASAATTVIAYASIPTSRTRPAAVSGFAIDEDTVSNAGPS